MPDTIVPDKTGNPAPLGLMGFGMTTVLLNLHNAGFIGLDTMILSMGIFYGGLAQVIAGIMEWKKGNTFACTAFISYGMFWLSLVSLIALPHAGLGLAGPCRVFDSRIPGRVGRLHARLVYWNAAPESCVASRLCNADHLVLHAGSGRRTRQRRHWQGCRLGRTSLWSVSHLHRPGAGIERSERQDRVAARACGAEIGQMHLVGPPKQGVSARAQCAALIIKEEIGNGKEPESHNP